jgi:NAD(P)-dependent dehydrogenase (short-subunit alcohol dehydrogenase family)
MGSSSNDALKANKLFDVSNYSAIVTGGGSGIGLMITQSFVANGAKVYITGRRKEALDRVVETYNTGPGQIIAYLNFGYTLEQYLILIQASGRHYQERRDLAIGKGGRIEGAKGDSSPRQQCRYCSRRQHEVLERSSRCRGQLQKIPTSQKLKSKYHFQSAQSISEHLWKSDPSAWASTFETNVSSQFFVAAGFLPLLSKSTTSSYTPSIINVASISGVMKGSSNGQFAYAASKAAFLHLTRMQATTFLKAKIRVNCIAPGVFPSEMTTGDSDESQKSSIEREASNPSGRFGQDSDMAACALFLAGPAGTFLNGQVVYPDGGMYSLENLNVLG